MNEICGDQQAHLRDWDELEGTLLVADIVEIPDDQSNAINRLPSAQAEIIVTPQDITATHAGAVMSRNEYVEEETYTAPSRNRNAYGEEGNDYVVEDAVVFPSYAARNDEEEERKIIAAATLKGRMQAEQEIEEIQRNNRNVNAINYFMERQVEQANQNAALQNFNEEAGCTQTSHAIPKVKTVPAPIRKEPEYQPGNYGKPYEPSEYETSYAYQTTDYETTEYKSCYDP